MPSSCGSDAGCKDRIHNREGFRAGLEAIFAGTADLLAVQRGDSVIGGIEVHIVVEEDVLRGYGLAVAESDAVLQEVL